MDLNSVKREAEDRMKHSLEHVQREFAGVRTGRATPALVEDIKVEYYGTPTALKQIAGISVPEAKLIIIQPWDPTAIADIEKAILKANIGITPNNDGRVIRLSIPQLSEETRKELARTIKHTAEEFKVSLRSIRREINEKIEALEKDKKISEDDSFQSKENIQKLTDKYTEKIEELLKAKEKELLEF